MTCYRYPDQTQPPYPHSQLSPHNIYLRNIIIFSALQLYYNVQQCASRYYISLSLSTECSGCHAHKMWEGADNCVSGLHYLLVLAPCRRYRYIYTSPLLPACFLRRDLVPSPRPRYCDTSPRPVLPVLCTFTLNLFIYFSRL